MVKSGPRPVFRKNQDLYTLSFHHDFTAVRIFFSRHRDYHQELLLDAGVPVEKTIVELWSIIIKPALYIATETPSGC